MTQSDENTKETDNNVKPGDSEISVELEETSKSIGKGADKLLFEKQMLKR